MNCKEGSTLSICICTRREYFLPPLQTMSFGADGSSGPVTFLQVAFYFGETPASHFFNHGRTLAWQRHSWSNVNTDPPDQDGRGKE